MDTFPTITKGACDHQATSDAALQRHRADRKLVKKSMWLVFIGSALLGLNAIDINKVHSWKTNLLVQETSTVTSSPRNIRQQEPGLWVHVVDWAEGMAAWRVSLQEVLAIAKFFNATFVEPCVESARLISCCQTRDNGRNQQTRLGDIMNLNALRSNVYDKIVTYEKFVKTTGYNYSNRQDDERIFPVCLNFRQYETCQGMDADDVMNTTHGEPWQPTIDKAVEASNNSTVILEIMKYRKLGLAKYHYNRKQRIDSLAPGAMKNVGFPKAQYRRVQRMLRKNLNISQGLKFAAIQWRPEWRHGNGRLNYTRCAEQLLQSRDYISERDGIPKENFILMSPLSTKKELQWRGVKKRADQNANASYPALQMLLDAGFLKLENAMDAPVKDGGLLAIWDFIVAQKASTFSTCSGCKRPGCAACNYQGQSVKYVLGLRRDANPSGRTYRCWPGLD